MSRLDLSEFELPPHPDYKPGYWLVRRTAVATLPCPFYGPGKVFQWDYDIKKKLPAERARKTGRAFSKGVAPRPLTGDRLRPDLFVDLPTRDDKKTSFGYCHLIACALLEATEDVDGRRCVPHYVRPQDQWNYEADHDPIPDQCDCRIENLALRHTDRHRGERRQGWQITTIHPTRRGVKRPRSALRKPAAMQRPAAARRTRLWQNH